MLGDLLAADGAVADARTAFEHVGEKSRSFASAQGKLAWTYQAAGDKAQALKLAEKGWRAAPGDRDQAATYAEILRVNDRWDEAVKVLDPAVAAAPADWRLLYMRGVALERAGRWPDAERDLNAALKIQPENPELLNYLGYSWIDRGEHLDQALDMVRRAVAANPQSGAVTDSLGWAQYRLGDYASAVTTLEKAAALEPADPDINDHLGDVYWRLGRKVEAQYKWRAVLTLEPDAKLKAEVEKKLASGLDPAPAKAVTAQK